MTAGFDDLMAQVMTGARSFGHRQHVQLTWLAIREHGVRAAVDLVSDGIRRTARYAGAPQKYHYTVSRAWVELIGYHMDDLDADFDAFIGRRPALLDKRLVGRHYRSTTLASGPARAGWIPPDLVPFPWR